MDDHSQDSMHEAGAPAVLPRTVLHKSKQVDAYTLKLGSDLHSTTMCEKPA